MKKRKNKKQLSSLIRSKKFKESLEFSLFQTRVSSIIFNGRKELGLSQRELARMSGTTQRIISEAENGNYNIAEMLYRIFRALNKELVCDGSDLITGKKTQKTVSMYLVPISKDVEEKYNFDRESEKETCNPFALQDRKIIDIN